MGDTRAVGFHRPVTHGRPKERVFSVEEYFKPASDPSPRFLLYSHDGFGLGHTRRNLAIARALSVLAPDAPVLLATGTDDVNRLGVPEGVEVLKLPGLRKVANGRYEARQLRVAPTEIRNLRSTILAGAAKAFRPTVVLVDKHPFGANGEFREALRIIRSHGGRTVLGLRDILDNPATVLREWGPHEIPGGLADYYDRILIYGDRQVLDPVEAYAFPEAVARRTVFCGYVVTPPEEPSNLGDGPPVLPPRPHPRPIVLATAGGGEDGYFVLKAFLRAASTAAWDGVAVSGPLMPAHDREALRSFAERSGAAFQGFVPGLSAYVGGADAIVGMGGYNTLAEAASRGVPIVCVPRTHPRQEQWMRARAFERLGLLQIVRPDELGSRRLREAVDAALHGPPRTHGPDALPWDGAERAARELLRVAAPEPAEEAEVRA